MHLACNRSVAGSESHMAVEPETLVGGEQQLLHKNTHSAALRTSWLLNSIWAQASCIALNKSIAIREQTLV